MRAESACCALLAFLAGSPITYNHDGSPNGEMMRWTLRIANLFVVNAIIPLAASALTRLYTAEGEGKRIIQSLLAVSSDCQ